MGSTNNRGADGPPAKTFIDHSERLQPQKTFSICCLLLESASLAVCISRSEWLPIGNESARLVLFLLGCQSSSSKLKPYVT